MMNLFFLDLNRPKYKPTYDHPELDCKAGKSGSMKEFYCEICCKQLNGPQPYRAHIASKAHKEEVEYSGMG